MTSDSEISALIDVGGLLTIDVASELRKLSLAQLQGPWQLPSELVRRALRDGATQVEVDLARHGVELVPGREYRWFVSIGAAGASPAEGRGAPLERQGVTPLGGGCPVGAGDREGGDEADGPGLGVEIDESKFAEVNAMPRKQFRWPTPTLKDGAVRDY